MSELPNEALLNGCYSVEKVLGRGGFGITYLANDTKLNLPVAVKEYLPEPFASRSKDLSVEPFENKHSEFEWGLSRFISEAQILAQFKHPNIVRVNAAFEQHGTAYMVMEYEQGVSLAEYILQEDSDRSEAFFEKYLFTIIDGLQGIHDKGFLHRDIKPANLMVRADSGRTPVLIDFGSARRATGLETGKLTAVTSAGYSPVEQHNADMGEQGPWTDIYALAAAIRESITGEVPPLSLTREFATRSGPENDPLRPLFLTYANRGYSHSFLKALDEGLAILPDDRPQSLEEWKTLFSDDNPTVVANNQPRTAESQQLGDSSSIETVVAAPVKTEQPMLVGSDRVPEKSSALDGTLLHPTRGDHPDNRQLVRPAREVRVANDSGSNGGSGKQGASSNKMLAGAAVAVVGLGILGWMQMSGQKDTESADNSSLGETAIVSKTDTSPSNDPVLPRPDAPIELISPVVRVKQQVVALNNAVAPFVQLVGEDGNVPANAVEPLEETLTQYRTLSESEIVLASKEVKSELLSGLSQLSVASADANQLKEALAANSTLDAGEIDNMLGSWREVSGDQRSKLIFTLASMTDQQREGLQNQAALKEMISEMNNSIRSAIEVSDFQSAARMVEVAMMLGEDNEALQSYKSLLQLE